MARIGFCEQNVEFCDIAKVCAQAFFAALRKLNHKILQNLATL